MSGFIDQLKGGQDFPELAGLNAQECQQVLDELVSIMATYEDRCQR